MRGTAFLAVLLATNASAQVVTTAAPDGDPVLVALQAIRSAGHPCPAINTASRGGDGGIWAVCDNGEKYGVIALQGTGTIAIRCSVARKHGANIC